MSDDVINPPKEEVIEQKEEPIEEEPKKVPNKKDLPQLDGYTQVRIFVKIEAKIKNLPNVRTPPSLSCCSIITGLGKKGPLFF